MHEGSCGTQFPQHRCLLVLQGACQLVLTASSSSSAGLCSSSFPLPCSVCWRAHNLQLLPASQLVPLQFVSGTHLDINLTLLPPPAATAATAAATAATAATTAAAAATAAATSATAAVSSPAGTEDLDTALAAAADGPRAGLVFRSWKPGGKGAAVLSFDWGSGVLMFDFDEPFPDAYNPHPDDTPERRRVGGRLRHYTAGVSAV